LFSSWYSEKIAHLLLSNNHSLILLDDVFLGLISEIDKILWTSPSFVEFFNRGLVFFLQITCNQDMKNLSFRNYITIWINPNSNVSTGYRQVSNLILRFTASITGFVNDDFTKFWSFVVFYHFFVLLIFFLFSQKNIYSDLGTLKGHLWEVYI
jgi:hypothetical protein